MLRVQQEEYQKEKIAALQAQLEESHKTRSELDTENRLTELISLCKSATDRCDAGCFSTSLSAALLLISLFCIVLNSFFKHILFCLLHCGQSAD